MNRGYNIYKEMIVARTFGFSLSPSGLALLVTRVFFVVMLIFRSEFIKCVRDSGGKR